MNIYQSIKLRYLTYRLFYIIFLGLNLLLFFGIPLIFRDIDSFTLNIIAISGTLVFTFLLGIYEYQVLIERFRTLSNNKKDFFYGSIVFSLINSIIQTGFIFILVLHFDLFEHKNVFLLLIFIFTFFVFSIANLFSMLFIKIIYLIKILALIGIAIFGYFLNPILIYLNENILEYLNNSSLIIKTISILLVALIFSYSFVFYLINKRK